MPDQLAAHQAARDREMLHQAVDLEQDLSASRSCAIRQLDRRLPAGDLVAGRDVAQRRRLARGSAASANGQRGEKRQPAGWLLALGTVPSMVDSRSRSTSSRGIEPSRPIV